MPAMKLNWKSVCVLLAAWFGLASHVVAKPPEPIAALKGLDPVELVSGKEVDGLEDHSAVRGLYRYQFMDATNKMRFEKEPEKFAIRLGGACARMGLLSGSGSPDRFWVYNQHIFLFASDACRSGFQTAPDKLLDAANPPPEGTEADTARGKRLLQKLVEGLGGIDRVDSAKSFRARVVQKFPADGGEREYVTEFAAVFPDHFRQSAAWDKSLTADVTVGETGFRMSNDTAWDMEPAETQFLRRDFFRRPLVVAKWRNDPRLKAVAAGEGNVGDTPVEWLKVGLFGATTTFGIDAKTGRVLQANYLGRTPGVIGDVSKSYSDFRNVGGLSIPFATTAVFLGTSAPRTGNLSSFEINPGLDAKAFVKPQ
ncbi:MAG: hypothetical protein HZA46_15540 [Planctomycetales bacterium]|nr:hypothetical protein [Planctomycetales bacterium]